MTTTTTPAMSNETPPPQDYIAAAAVAPFPLSSIKTASPRLSHCRSCPSTLPLSLHCLSPRRLTLDIVHRPPSTQQHCRHRHRCNLLLTPTTLVALSTLSARCCRCRHDPLRAPTALITPSAARSCRAIPPPGAAASLPMLLPLLAAAFVAVVVVSAS